MALFRALPRGDTKPLAKALLKTFRHAVARCSPRRAQRLKEVDGVGDARRRRAEAHQAFAERTAGEAVRKRPVLSSWAALLDYCRAAMAYRGARAVPHPLPRRGSEEHTPATNTSISAISTL